MLKDDTPGIFLCDQMLREALRVVHPIESGNTRNRMDFVALDFKPEISDLKF
jgi:hypothetical protein